MKTADKKPKLNVRLLRKIQKHILEEPRRLNMHKWLESSEEAPCGTVACIAGWAISLSRTPQNTLAAIRNGEIDLPEVAELAADKLGMSQHNRSLFYASLWQEPFASRYEDAYESGNKHKVAEVVSARIEHFIKTKGAE